MEPPSKRPRLSLAPDPNDDYDNNEPGTDPIDIQTARAQNDSRLKSIFESIFQKYEKDFTEVGDEVDLETGEVVVNNGHLLGMQGEDDTGEDGGGWQYEDLSTPAAHNPDDEHGDSGTEIGDDGDGGIQPQHTGTSQIQKQLADKDDTWDSQRGEYEGEDDDDDRSSVDSLLDIALSVNDTDFPGRMTATTIPTSKKAIPAVQTSDPLHRVEESKPVESIWRVPEISAKFSTPTTTSRPRPAPSFNNIGFRSASPPGSRSLWALPQTRKPRKANTDIAKPRKGKKDVDANVSAKKTKTAFSPSKPRHFPSSIVNDWSFADTPDGSESDDPLQEDYQPSPTPKAALNIRGKRMGSGTPNRTQKQHDGMGTVAKNVIDETPTESKSQSIFDGSAREQGGPSPSPNKTEKPKNDSTPTKRARAPMTPDEIKLIVTMRHIQKKQWKEVHDYLPERKPIQLIQWNQLHWNERRACPPQLSKPWSQEERDKLVKFKDQQGLTWPGIRAELPGRLLMEIEFELLRLWVGEEVWNEEKHQVADQPGEQESFSQQPGDLAGKLISLSKRA